MVQDEQQTLAQAPAVDGGDAEDDLVRQDLAENKQNNAPAAENAVPTVAGGGNAYLNDDIEILPDKRLPALDKGEVKAYAARTRGQEGSEPYFAMVCERHISPRGRQGGAFSSVINPNLVRLLASGPMFWPPTGDYRYCFVYENTLSRPLMAYGDPGLGWKQDFVLDNIIGPMIYVLHDLRNADIVHGNINPMNIFTGAEGVVDKLVLGECLCVPTGYAQPVVFETVPRGMCDPVSRGRGTHEDDLYSFGVTLTYMLRKKDPLAGLDDKEIIREKITHGSYAALTGKDRFTGAILELLRGLLYDDDAQRWTLDEVQSWMDGQRLSPKQSSRAKKAARPLLFNDRKYYRPSTLAMDLNDDQAEAVAMIDNETLEKWLNRSLENHTVEKNVEQVLEASEEMRRGAGYWDKILARISIALHPEAPIRYQGHNIHPEGLPLALTQAVVKKENVQPFVDVINDQLVFSWLGFQTSMKVDVGSLSSKYDSCRTFLRQNKLGYGVERCLYYLDPEVPCQSDKVSRFYVRTPEDLLRVYEEVSKDPDRPALFIDRHVAAFLSVKDRKNIDVYWGDLNADDFARRLLGNIKVLATIQKRERMEKLPGVSRWMIEMLEPVYERYHDRRLRENLKEKVEKYKDTGDLTKIAAVFDNSELLQKDFRNFRSAMAEYQIIKQEGVDLEKELENRETFGADTGREVAAVVSCFLSGLIILAMSFIYFIHGGL